MAGKVEGVKDNGKLIAEYSYHEDRTLQKVSFANGIETEYTYDADKITKASPPKQPKGKLFWNTLMGMTETETAHKRQEQNMSQSIMEMTAV